jgi:hypothetical protein
LRHTSTLLHDFKQTSSTWRASVKQVCNTASLLVVVEQPCKELVPMIIIKQKPAKEKAHMETIMFLSTSFFLGFTVFLLMGYMITFQL